METEFDDIFIKKPKDVAVNDDFDANADCWLDSGIQRLAMQVVCSESPEAWTGNAVTPPE